MRRLVHLRSCIKSDSDLGSQSSYSLAVLQEHKLGHIKLSVLYLIWYVSSEKTSMTLHQKG